jgi:preprotein translocase subunit SecF
MIRSLSFRRMLQPFLLGVLVLAPVGVACAWQSTVQPVVRPVVVAPPDAQFQQTVQQQQVRNQLQQSQLQQQLHQSVSDTAKTPSARNALASSQQEQADEAQRDRDRAAQQDAVDRYRARASLPRVIPQDAPASPRSGG